MKITYDVFAEGLCYPKDDSIIMSLKSGEEFVVSFVKKGLELSDFKAKEIQDIIHAAGSDIASVLLSEE